jgi:hypothetical protein
MTGAIPGDDGIAKDVERLLQRVLEEDELV